MLKHEWRKKEKNLYLPKATPTLVDVPALTFLTIDGEGSPDTPFFAQCIQTLYALSYAIKMKPKKMAVPPDGYYDYTVYPLEGIWDLNEAGRKKKAGPVDRANFVFELLIRQPDYLTPTFFQDMLALTRVQHPTLLLDQVQLKTQTEGLALQMLHVGPFATEPTTFAEMEAVAKIRQLRRLSKVHREIYLSDFRKVAPERLKTVLRFSVQKEVL